jgi:hypothetical protein
MRRLLSRPLFAAAFLVFGCSGSDSPAVSVDAAGEDSMAVEDGASKDSGPTELIPGELTVPPEDGTGESNVAGDGEGEGPVAEVTGGDGREPDDAAAAPDDGGSEPAVTVSTYAEASTVPAGVPLQFECIVQGLPAGGYVTYLHVTGPADVEFGDLAVTFFKKGKYQVACVAKWEEGTVEDATPLKIDVQPGKAAKVETALSANSVKAGDSVKVTCSIEDAYGNPVETPAVVAVNPQLGLVVTGMKLLAQAVGTYMVACLEPLSGVADASPETLTVGWGLPKRIETTLEKEQIVAGKSTTVSCAAYDAFDNVVPDFPISVFLSPGLKIAGYSVSGTKVGSYQVICVPEKESWDLFILTPRQLTIIPGAATGVSVEAVPSKPTYKMFEMVQFVVTAVDDFGNIVEGVELLPMSFQPSNPGIKEKAPLKYKFEAEGVFLFTSCLAENPKVCGSREVTVDGYGPVITIKYPERGATIMGKPAVNVTGNVVDPVSGVASFKINNFTVPLDENGDFTFPISAKQGLNLIVAVAEDPNGFKTLLVQSFYYSPVWYKVDINNPKSAMIMDGLRFWLADEFFDKVPHDYSKPDNLSTVAEMALKSLDIGSFIPNPVASAGPYKVYVGPFSYSPPVIHIFPITQGILAEVHIYNVKVHVEANGSCKVLFIDFCPDVSGTVKIEELQMWEGLNIWAEDGKIKMSQYENFIGIYGLEVDIDGILGFLFGWIIDWFVGSYVQTLEETAMKMVDEQIKGITEGLLDQLSLNQELAIPNPLDPNGAPVTLMLSSYIRDLKFCNAGVELKLDAAVLAPKKVNKNPLGSIGRASCLKWVAEEFVMDQELFAIMGIHDDLINEVLFSAWYAGLLDMKIPLTQFVEPGQLDDALKQFGLESFEQLGFSMEDMAVRTEFFLPPIITSCPDPYDQTLQMQIGDIYVELTTKILNEPVTMGMFISMAAEASIEIVTLPDGSQEIKLGIGKVDPIFAQITYMSDNLKGAEGFLSMIVQAILVPTLLEQFAENSLASFPIPVVNVSQLSNFLPPNMVWKFIIDKFWRELGYTALIAHIQAL